MLTAFAMLGWLAYVRADLPGLQPSVSPPGKGVNVYAVHPGRIASNIWQRMPWPVRPLLHNFMDTPENGAISTVRAAVAEEAANETGLYYNQRGHIRSPNPLALDKELAAEVWRRSEEWTR